MLLQLDEEE
jgi:hypothetical protein